ncbi:MAG TPA: UDP-N-acetylmuramate dehydrogenase [Candidatus Merdenecus merdavium]|nr:UDP-N-acetylmuramate dehydrogenase [Candidatus Merdenecus merdavium]
MNLESKKKLVAVVGQGCAFEQEPMKDHTTFRIGGPADLFLCPHSITEIQQLVRICKEDQIPYYIMGNGSNLLVSDEGYRGVIIQIYENFNQIQIEGTVVTAQAGALLALIAKKALKESLTGFEFASGIPGTLGGAAVMNAGAYGGEMKDVLLEVTALTKEGEILILPKEQLELGYRTSIVSKKDYMVLEAKIGLDHGDYESISSLMEELTEKRTSKQPLEFGSGGSTFKRPEGYFAGKLIMDSGLRGFQIGDAQVSEKHCGFVINRGNATAKDVRQVMGHVIDTVKDKFGVTLEPEIKMLGEFNTPLTP